MTQYKYIQLENTMLLSEYAREQYSVLRLNRAIDLAQEIKGHFTLSVNKLQFGWEYRCMDFIMYENFHGRTVISFLSNEMIQQCLKIYGDSHFIDAYRRDHEPQYLVHATSCQSFQDICKEGCLLSYQQRCVQKGSEIHYGNRLIREPSDYSEYIMLSNIENVVGELLVKSRKENSISYNSDKEYVPGVRIYFELARLANDNKIVRDGIHFKVKDRIELNQYACAIITTNDLAHTEQKPWTPKNFLLAANMHFLDNICR